MTTHAFNNVNPDIFREPLESNSVAAACIISEKSTNSIQISTEAHRYRKQLIHTSAKVTGAPKQAIKQQQIPLTTCR